MGFFLLIFRWLFNTETMAQIPTEFILIRVSLTFSVINHIFFRGIMRTRQQKINSTSGTSFLLKRKFHGRLLEMNENGDWKVVITLSRQSHKKTEHSGNRQKSASPASLIKYKLKRQPKQRRENFDRDTRFKQKYVNIFDPKKTFSERENWFSPLLFVSSQRLNLQILFRSTLFVDSKIID